MPVYDYQCVCGHRQEAFRKIDDRHKSPNCEQCGGYMHQIIINGFRNGMIGYPYMDPVLECVVESPRHKSPNCEQCGGHMHQIIISGFRNGMIGYPYIDPVLECVVESPRQKRELLQSLGLEQKC